MNERRINCPMRHPDNGNCLVAGGFCTAVSDPICEALHNAYDCGLRSVSEHTPLIISASPSDTEIEEMRRLLNQGGYITILPDEPAKTEPCEYCDGQEKRLFAVEGDGSTYATHAGIWFNSGKAYLGDSDGCDIPIKYCPMCGRRLEDNNG